jgi:hypothetical protein
VNRDLDATIEEQIFGWTLAHVGPDYDGRNECDILTPDGRIPDNYDLPRVGKLHRGFLCRNFSGDWHLALTLAQKVGLRTPVCDLPNSPEKLSEVCLKQFNERRLAGITDSPETVQEN